MILFLLLATNIGFDFGYGAIVHKWGQWSPVSRSCNRPCVKPYARKALGRTCLRCEDKHCRRSATNLCKGLRTKVGTCYVGSQCFGQGPYTGSWSEWTVKVKCPPSKSCKAKKNTIKKRVVLRTCQPSSTSTTSFKCPVVDGVAEVRRDRCRCSEAGLQSWDRELSLDRKYGRWGGWGQWTCNTQCETKKTMAVRRRKCLRFIAGFYCKPDHNNVKEVQRAPCRVGTVIRCKMKWGIWGDWSHCKVTCGEQTRKRKRYCTGFGEACKGKKIEYSPCPIARHCPLVDGKWGGWGRWELKCSVTCGHGVRKRVRLCNDPAPSGGGRKCEGPADMVETCSVDVVCPIHGGWTAWSDWVCDTTCDGTVGQYTVF